MPVQKVGDKYKWGEKGKLYATRKEAEAQGKAIKAKRKK